VVTPSGAAGAGIDVAAFHQELELLLRQSARVRRTPRRRDATEATLEAAIDAAGAIIDEQGVEGLRIADVCERAGIGSSSVYHLFGDRDGLIAATLIDRFDRSVGTSGTFQRLASSLADSPQGVIEFGRQYLVSVYTDPARERSRWDRIIALGTACHRPPLAERLGGALCSYVDRMVGALTAAQQAGIVRSDVDLVALALYGQAHQFGLLSNRFDRDPVPVASWEAVAMRTMAMLSPGAEEPRIVLPPRGERVARRAAAPAPFADRRVQAVIDLAKPAFERGGSEAISVAEIRSAVGVSAGWFHRHFGDRDGLIDEVRLTVFEERFGAETAGLIDAMRGADRPEEFLGRLLVLAAGVLSGATRSELWFRVEVLAAIEGRPALRRAVAEIDARHTALLVDAIADAQRRGIIAADLDARAVARFAQGMHYGFLLGAISGLEPTGEQWQSVFAPVVWGLTPTVVHSP
jgi:AcrR family transcriptional regulator